MNKESLRNDKAIVDMLIRTDIHCGRNLVRLHVTGFFCEGDITGSEWTGYIVSMDKISTKR